MQSFGRKIKVTPFFKPQTCRVETEEKYQSPTGFYLDITDVKYMVNLRSKAKYIFKGHHPANALQTVEKWCIFLTVCKTL